MALQFRYIDYHGVRFIKAVKGLPNYNFAGCKSGLKPEQIGFGAMKKEVEKVLLNKERYQIQETKGYNIALVVILPNLCVYHTIA